MPIYDYTDNGIPDAIVDTDSEEFLNIVDWIMEETGADSYEVKEYTGYNVSGGNSYTRALVEFVEGSMYSQSDAYLLSKSPDVAVVEVFQGLGMTVPNPAPKYTVPNAAVDPVGPPWPSKGSNIWHPSAQFDAAKWPVGATHTKVVDGLTKTFYRTTVRGKAAPSGTVGGSATYVPAWTDKPNP